MISTCSGHPLVIDLIKALGFDIQAVSSLTLEFEREEPIVAKVTSLVQDDQAEEARIVLKKYRLVAEEVREDMCWFVAHEGVPPEAA